MSVYLGINSTAFKVDCHKQGERSVHEKITAKICVYLYMIDVISWSLFLLSHVLYFDEIRQVLHDP